MFNVTVFSCFKVEKDLLLYFKREKSILHADNLIVYYKIQEHL